jgi:hypothetical protein
MLVLRIAAQGETAMPTFFIACASALVTAPVSAIALDHLRYPGSVAFATAGVRL